MKPAYYNEIDPYCAQWLRNLISAGHLPAGDVDERSIADVQPDDLRPYGACHFFGGLGGWPLAARLAGIADHVPIWTGSCPCQPFSAAGKGLGFADERHLWPHFFRLIRECRPERVFGEQVASAIGKPPPNKAVRTLRGGEAARGVLLQLERRSAQEMQILRSGRGEGPQKGHCPGCARTVQAVAHDQSWARAGERGETPREREGATFRGDGGRGSRGDRPWSVSGDRTPVFAGNSARVERTVARPDDPWGWLYESEYESSSLCAECYGEHLGRELHPASGGRAAGSPSGSLTGSERPDSGEPEGIASWLDLVQADLETEGYTFGAVDLCAASVGAPHIRQRLYWAAYANGGQRGGRAVDGGSFIDGQARGRHEGHGEPSGRGAARGVADDTSSRRREERALAGGQPAREREEGWAAGLEQRGGAGEWMADANPSGRSLERRGGLLDGERPALGDDADGCGESDWLGDAMRPAPARLGRERLPLEPEQEAGRPGDANPWAGAVLVQCADGRARPVEPGVQPLAHGVPGRVGRLRAYGNSIIPQVAAAFLKALP